MRTSLVEIAQLERWYLKQGPPQDRLVTEAKLLADPALHARAQAQQQAYELALQYGREKLRKEIQDVEHRLFQDHKFRSFQQRIRTLFK